MKKKLYIIPCAKAFDIRTEGMLAASKFEITNENVDDVDRSAKRQNIWNSGSR